MELIALFVIGIFSGQIASLCYGGYSLGAIGNSIAGLTGALFLGKYLSPLFGIPLEAGMLAGGILGAFVILAVFNAGESMTRKKNRFF
jgi:uncharacterized membrane protein YeaQ/YmgE (transglycosylase-associated protein family)